jgi:hypothetical protein
MWNSWSGVVGGRRHPKERLYEARALNPRQAGTTDAAGSAPCHEAQHVHPALQEHASYGLMRAIDMKLILRLLSSSFLHTLPRQACVPD